MVHVAAWRTVPGFKVCAGRGLKQRPSSKTSKRAEVAELADALVQDLVGLTRGGSSPLFGILRETKNTGRRAFEMSRFRAFLAASPRSPRRSSLQSLRGAQGARGRDNARLLRILPRIEGNSSTAVTAPMDEAKVLGWVLVPAREKPGNQLPSRELLAAPANLAGDPMTVSIPWRSVYLPAQP